MIWMLIIAAVTYAWDASESKKEAHRQETLLRQAYEMRRLQAELLVQELQKRDGII